MTKVNYIHDDAQKICIEGIIEPSNNKFNFDRAITRREMAKMITLAIKKDNETIETAKARILLKSYEDNGNKCFDDVSDAQFKLENTWGGADYICNLKSKGIISNNSNFNPDSNITYKEASKMLLLKAFSYGNNNAEKCWKMDEGGLWYPRYVDYMNDMLHNFNKNNGKQGGENTNSSEIVSRGLFARMLLAALAEKKRIYNCDQFSSDFEEVIKEDPNCTENCNVYIPVRVYPTYNEMYNFKLSKKISYFKFKVEPGYYYSFIVDTGKYNHIIKTIGPECTKTSATPIDSTVAGFSMPDYDILGNDSPAKTAAIFHADPSTCSGKYYYAYIELDNWKNEDIKSEDVPDIPVAKIQLLKMDQKKFGLPIKGLHGYYNAFKHKEKIYGGEYPTKLGHNGIDIAPYTPKLDGVDLARSIFSVADGKVIKIIPTLGSIYDQKNKKYLKLGGVVFVQHTFDNQSDTYTSVYAHLENIQVSKGDSVTKGITSLGYTETDQQHFHVEIYPKNHEIWDNGYCDGCGGQTDPLGVIFEK